MGDENTKVKKEMAFAIASILLLTVLPIVAIQSTVAKVTDTVSGGSISYYSRGNVTVDISSLNFKLGNGYVVPKLFMQATHYDVSTTDPEEHDTLMLQIQVTSTGIFVPLGIFSTGPETIPFLQNAFKSLPVYKPGPPTINNIFLVGNDQLQVVRHGNSISVNFNPKNPITLYMSANTYPNPSTTIPFVVPSFHVEFNKYGDSIYSEITQTTLRPYSGYVVHYSFTGFQADASFTSEGWNMNNVAGAGAFITMHGNQTWIPGPIGPA